MGHAARMYTNNARACFPETTQGYIRAQCSGLLSKSHSHQRTRVLELVDGQLACDVAEHLWDGHLLHTHTHTYTRTCFCDVCS